MMLYKKKAKRAPAAPRVRAGSSRPAALLPLAEADALLEEDEPELEPEPEPDVEVGLEPEEPEEPEDPDALEPPDVLLPVEVPLPLLPEPPVVVVPLPLGMVPFPTPEEGTTTGDRVLLATTGRVPAGEVAAAG